MKAEYERQIANMQQQVELNSRYVCVCVCICEGREGGEEGEKWEARKREDRAQGE